MGNKAQAKVGLAEEQTNLFITRELTDFKKLCKDINKIKQIFTNEKYLHMIGFNLDIKIYYDGNLLTKNTLM